MWLLCGAGGVGDDGGGEGEGEREWDEGEENGEMGSDERWEGKVIET